MITVQRSYDDYRRGFDPEITHSVVTYEIRIIYFAADDERARCDSEQWYLELHGRHEVDNDRNIEFQSELQAMLAKWQLVAD